MPTVRRLGLFPARAEALRDARALVEAFAAAAGLDELALGRLTLVVEELFVNTVRHGYRGGSDAPVWIRLTGDGSAIRLTYEDHAPPFNPFAEGNAELPESPAEAQREGGLGVYLARRLTAEPEYAYLFGRNRLRLTLAG